MSAWPPARFLLDPDARLLRRGQVVVGGQPVRLITLAPAGAELLRRALAGELGEEPPPRVALLERLTEAGILHPAPRPAPAPARREDVTLAIPARDEAGTIGGLVTALAPTVAEVLVVDDGSRDRTAELAGEAGARVLRHERPRGPAAARNAALSAARTELIAFLDADCLPPPRGWLDRLAAHLDAPRTVLAAPRVRGAEGVRGSQVMSRAIARYERLGCPLDMGPRPALVGPERTVPYVPSAAMLASRRALLEAGGFDEALRHGEDVDLVWRLGDQGLACRYDPEVEVEHLARPTLAAFARQRFGYGRSAIDLEARHPGAVAPVRGSGVALAAALATPWAGALPTLAVASYASQELAEESPLTDREALGLTLGGGLATMAGVARVLAREWLPATVGAAALSRRLRPLALMAAAGLAADELPGRSRKEAAPALALGLVARGAYAAGLWSGIRVRPARVASALRWRTSSRA